MKPRKLKIVDITEPPVLAAMCLRVLSRMMKSHKHSIADQRLALRTLDRLADAMETESAEAGGCIR
jgi:hypothetical protein